MGERSYEKGESVSRAGLTVHQLYTESEFDVPSVVLKLVSSRDEPVFVRLVVPALQTDRIGFHADFEGDSWSVEDGRLVFESDLDADSELTTLYAVESGGVETIGAAMESLQIDAVESLDSPETTGSDQLLGGNESPSGDDPLDESGFEAIVDEDETTLVETAENLDIGTDPDETLVDPDDIDSGGEGGATDASPETETAFESETAASETDSTAGSVEFEEQLDDLETGSEDSPASGTSETEPTRTDQDEADGVGGEQHDHSGAELESIPTRQLVEALTARLDTEELTPQQRRKLQATGLAEGSGREDVRDEQISHLQARVSDVETFTDSIERLFEEYGPPDEVFEEYDQQLERLESRVEQLDQLEGSLDGVQERIQDVESSVETVEASVDAVETSVEGVENSVEDVEETVGSLESEVSETSEAVEAVEDSQEDLESEMEDLQRWRKKITNALQAIMGE
jgi:archaellum component FlaC